DGSRLESTNAPPWRTFASVDDRAERAHQLQEPHHPGAGVCQHDRPGTVPGGRSHHRRRRRLVRPPDAMARPFAAHDFATRADDVDSEHLYADAGRSAVLLEGAFGAIGG